MSNPLGNVLGGALGSALGTEGIVALASKEAGNFAEGAVKSLLSKNSEGDGKEQAEQGGGGFGLDDVFKLGGNSKKDDGVGFDDVLKFAGGNSEKDDGAGLGDVLKFAGGSSNDGGGGAADMAKNVIGSLF